MKKIINLLISIILIGNLYCQNNDQIPYISELFTTTSSSNLYANLEAKFNNNIYATTDSVLFVINQKGFECQTKNGYGKIHKINIFTGEENTYYISPSAAYTENGGSLKRIWIWALAVSDSLLFIAVDEGVWVYHLTDENQYRFCKTIYMKDVSKLELTNNDLHAFVENDTGFDWVKVSLLNFEITNMKSLVLHNHFFLQIAPVKVIAMGNNALYLLQQSAPAIEKYSLTGDLLAKYTLKIPNWRKIPEEVAIKLDSIEDVTERNYAFSTLSIFDYNMIHLFYLFSCERFLMIAIDKNVFTETFVTPFFVQIIGDSAIVEPYSIKLNDNERFRENYFPFATAHTEGNVIFAQLNEYIIQINNSANVEWKNKTQKEFYSAVDLYHRDNEPIERIETYNFIKNYISADSIHFLDYDDHIFNLNDIKNDKAIFIISQYPQCSSCLKVIWSYFSKKSLHNTQLYNVAQNCPTYFMKKETIKEVNTFLKTEYTPLFIDTKKLNSATRRILAQQSNPIIVLYDKKLNHIEVISSLHIIGDEMGNLSPSFLHTIDNFVKN